MSLSHSFTDTWPVRCILSSVPYLWKWTVWVSGKILWQSFSIHDLINSSSKRKNFGGKTLPDYWQLKPYLIYFVYMDVCSLSILLKCKSQWQISKHTKSQNKTNNKTQLQIPEHNDNQVRAKPKSLSLSWPSSWHMLFGCMCFS